MVVVVCVGGYCFIDGVMAEVADAGVKGVAWGVGDRDKISL